MKISLDVKKTTSNLLKTNKQMYAFIRKEMLTFVNPLLVPIIICKKNDMTTFLVACYATEHPAMLVH